MSGYKFSKWFWIKYWARRFYVQFDLYYNHGKYRRARARIKELGIEFEMIYEMNDSHYWRQARCHFHPLEMNVVNSRVD